MPGLTSGRPHHPMGALALLAQVAIGLSLAAAVQAKDTGQLFISSEKDNGLVVVDAARAEVTGAIALCKRPRDGSGDFSARAIDHDQAVVFFR